jgi:hypothetical protein
MNMHGGAPAINDEFSEVIRYYDLWRKVASVAGGGPYDEADWENDRLYFRSDYSDKLKKWPEWAKLGDWAAWIIAPTSKGYFCVLRSLMHERASQRSETIEVMFSHSVDAGKYIVLRMGDSLRSNLRLQTLFIRWNDRGLNPRIEVDPASPEVIDFLIRETPTLNRDFAEKHLKSYTLKDDPSSYGFALPSEQTNMEVLALSFEELTAALLDGMPESITSKVPFEKQ